MKRVHFLAIFSLVCVSATAFAQLPAEQPKQQRQVNSADKTPTDPNRIVGSMQVQDGRQDPRSSTAKDKKSWSCEEDHSPKDPGSAVAGD